MDASARFRFDHRWAVPLPSARVLALLADPLGYPDWWPAILRARRVDDDRAAVLLRGLVPVRLVMERVTDDRAHGRLVARLHGDLEGTVTVQVHDDDGTAPASGARCRVVWEQEVVLGSRSLRAVARIPGARAAMRLSHAAAMRSARRALRASAAPSAGRGRSPRPRRPRDPAPPG